jgi:outer membrane PBP1 activator LpoA protein
MINPTLQKRTLRRSLPRLLAAMVLAAAAAFAVPAILLSHAPTMHEISLSH